MKNVDQLAIYDDEYDAGFYDYQGALGFVGEPEDHRSGPVRPEGKEWGWRASWSRWTASQLSCDGPAIGYVIEE